VVLVFGVLYPEKHTTPHSLFFDRFPRPMLEQSKEFVEDWTEITQTYQTSAMKLIIKLCETEIGKLENDNTFKNAICMKNRVLKFRVYCTLGPVVLNLGQKPSYNFGPIFLK
jgi:hypothetical protein